MSLRGRGIASPAMDAQSVPADAAAGRSRPADGAFAGYSATESSPDRGLHEPNENSRRSNRILFPQIPLRANHSIPIAGPRIAV